MTEPAQGTLDIVRFGLSDNHHEGDIYPVSVEEAKPPFSAAALGELASHGAIVDPHYLPDGSAWQFKVVPPTLEARGGVIKAIIAAHGVDSDVNIYNDMVEYQEAFGQRILDQRGREDAAKRYFNRIREIHDSDFRW